MMYLRLSVLLVCIAALLSQQSCKKGCTDKTALNYTHGAKDNDGSCLYCDSALQNVETSSRPIEDENSQSQFAFEDVLFAYVQAQGVVYTGNGCQKYNLGNSTTGCETLINAGGLVSQVNATIVFTGQITVVYEDGQQLSFSFNSAQIPPFDTLKVPNFGTVCIPETQQFFNLQLQQGYTITYQ